MSNFKHLITSGCSFTDIGNGYTWPLHLGASYGNIECSHLGLGSQGNGLIARKALYAVHTALKNGYKPEEILVGIMWSGHHRHDSYFKHLKNQIENNDNWVFNPTHVVNKSNDPGGWLIMNHHWTEKTCKIYYSHLHDSVNQRILTYEKILWVQNYFENLGINYFMTKFMDETIQGENADADILNPNVVWLEEQVNYKNWLPISSMHKWTYNFWTDEDYPIQNVRLHDGRELEIRDFHPRPDMHKRFVKDIVLPFIKERFADYYCPEFREHIHV